MNVSIAAGLFLLVGVASPQNFSVTKPNLELRLTPGKLLHGVPVKFTFELVNITDHDVYVPKPKVDCISSIDGYIWLELDFTPAKFTGSGSGFGCTEDQVGLPAILDRAKDWHLLHPGETVMQILGQHELHYDDKGAGTYEFWAEYHPPTINSQDQKTLREAGIDFPRYDLKTRRFVYKKH
ncbi:MAG: hypothetical protein KGN79_00470 [Acidobacteriota bacterium]|nr:hypothetical protein [Acidobacteriota bacterium]